MASSSSWFWFLHKEVVLVLLLLLILLHVAVARISGNPPRRCYNRIYSFGDSLADTGNLCYDPNIDSVPAKQTLVLNPPYGETFFHHPTGRWSNGRLIIDFIAEEMGTPLLQPYLGIKNKKIKDWKKTDGVNFAVGGATALTSRFYAEEGIVDISNIVTNYTLPIQLHWFINEFLPLIHNSSNLVGKEFLERSLLFVGEIGGNDFNHLLYGRASVQQLKPYVPLVIHQISMAINKLIDVGAQTLVVFGNLPIGCMARYLIEFEDSKMEYDEYGCLKQLNEFSQHYNEKLYEEINRLQVLHPHANIIYGDYYNAVLPLYQSPKQFGFTRPLMDVCCLYKDAISNEMKNCGSHGVIACEDPSQYISWDGIHFTEAAYKFIARNLLSGQFTHPKLDITSCHSEI